MKQGPVHNERSNLTQLSAIVPLVELRNRIGYFYGSEEICMLFYALVRRERPVNIVELGTGIGVTALWMAQAVKENGLGHVWTMDNASDWEDAKKVQAVLSPLAEVDFFADIPRSAASYESYMESIVGRLELGDQLTFLKKHLDIIDERDFHVGNYPFLEQPIDFLFLDIYRQPDEVLDTLYLFLPHLAESASIFIDSASTSVVSYLFLEKLVDQLNHSKVPRRFVLGESAERRQRLIELVSQRKFTLMHLVERLKRAQNSTAWIKVEPNDYVPHPQTLMKWV